MDSELSNRKKASEINHHSFTLRWGILALNVWIIGIKYVYTYLLQLTKWGKSHVAKDLTSIKNCITVCKNNQAGCFVFSVTPIIKSSCVGCKLKFKW